MTAASSPDAAPDAAAAASRAAAPEAKAWLGLRWPADGLVVNRTGKCLYVLMKLSYDVHKMVAGGHAMMLSEPQHPVILPGCQ